MRPNWRCRVDEFRRITYKTYLPTDRRSPGLSFWILFCSSVTLTCAKWPNPDRKSSLRPTLGEIRGPNQRLIPIALSFYPVVIARGAKRAVAIQPLDRLGALSLSKRLDCFVAPRQALGLKLVETAPLLAMTV
mgnify:CR=1 FL=1